MSIIHDVFSDIDEFDWRELATCQGVDPAQVSGEDDIFFDGYEADEVIARQTDELCLSCPVARQCFAEGRSGKSDGVWGGVYLVNGKPNKNYNRHKTDEVWHSLRKALGENVKV